MEKLNIAAGVIMAIAMLVSLSLAIATGDNSYYLPAIFDLMFIKMMIDLGEK